MRIWNWKNGRAAKTNQEMEGGKDEKGEVRKRRKRKKVERNGADYKERKKNWE